MQDKMATLRRLIDDGYHLEEIESESGCVQATFRRAGHRATIRLFPSDAERLLYAPRRLGRVHLRR